MESFEYKQMACHEQTHWWYASQRQMLEHTVRSVVLPEDARFLDVGCGTGRNLQVIRSASRADGFGIDIAPEAIALWNGEMRNQGCRASANMLPFGDHTFDLVTSIDMIECAGVNPDVALREMTRVMKTNGWIFLLVPAYQWMRSRHDEAVHCVRRFTRSSIRSLVNAAGLQVVRADYRYAVFLPFVAAVRLWRQRAVRRSHASVKSDLSHLPHFANECMRLVATVEHRIVSRIGAPFGSSILVVARKHA